MGIAKIDRYERVNDWKIHEGKARKGIGRNDATEPLGGYSRQMFGLNRPMDVTEAMSHTTFKSA